MEKDKGWGLDRVIVGFGEPLSCWDEAPVLSHLRMTVSSALSAASWPVVVSKTSCCQEGGKGLPRRIMVTMMMAMKLS